jgi:hypothetical protein
MAEQQSGVEARVELIERPFLGCWGSWGDTGLACCPLFS